MSVPHKKCCGAHALAPQFTRERRSILGSSNGCALLERRSFNAQCNQHKIQVQIYTHMIIKLAQAAPNSLHPSQLLDCCS